MTKHDSTPRQNPPSCPSMYYDMHCITTTKYDKFYSTSSIVGVSGARTLRGPLGGGGPRAPRRGIRRSGSRLRFAFALGGT